MIRALEFFTRNFFVWTILGGGLALIWPGLFTWFKGLWIQIGLGVIMLGMGLTLNFDDFKRVFRMPRPILLGVFLQFTIMPALGWSAGRLFGLPDHYAVGLILVASCPGGTASNVIAFLARANTALSVSMTAISTMLAVAMTPLLTGLLAGSRMEVDVIGLFTSTAMVVLLPVTLGVLLNRFLPRVTETLRPVAPAVAVLLIVIIVASILGKSRGVFLKLEEGGGYRMLFAVLFLHALGFGLGYGLARLLSGDERSARTVSIEVGMQNSGLGVILARAHFAANPLVAVPSALSALTHCIFGSLAAAWWGRRKVDGEEV